MPFQRFSRGFFSFSFEHKKYGIAAEKLNFQSRLLETALGSQVVFVGWISKIWGKSFFHSRIYWALFWYTFCIAVDGSNTCFSMRMRSFETRKKAFIKCRKFLRTYRKFCNFLPHFASAHDRISQGLKWSEKPMASCMYILFSRMARMVRREGMSLFIFQRFSLKNIKQKCF